MLSKQGVLIVVGALVLCLCNCTHTGMFGQSTGADGVTDVSDPKKAAAALLDEMGTAAVAQAKAYLEARDANIATWSQDLTPDQEAYMGTSPVMPCFADPGVAQAIAATAQAATEEVYENPGGTGGQAWFTPVPEPDPSTVSFTDPSRYYDDTSLYATENAASTLLQVYACAGIPAALTDPATESNSDRAALMANMKIMGTFAMRTAYAASIQRYVTNVWMEALAGQTPSDNDTQFIQNVVTSDVPTYLAGIQTNLSPYVQTLVSAGATFSTIASPDGTTAVPYQGFVYIDVTGVSLANIDAGIASKDPGTKSLLAAMGVLGGIPLMQQLVAPTAGKLTVVSSAVFGNGLYFVAPNGQRQFMLPSDWDAAIVNLHDQFVSTLQQYYQDAQDAASLLNAVENILESVISNVNLDQTPANQAVNSDYDNLTAILNQLWALGMPPAQYSAYANALIQALQTSNDELSALIAQLDELIPDFDRIHGKFHLGLYWAFAVPVVMYAAPALAGAVLGDSVASTVVASQAQAVNFSLAMWASQTVVQTGVDVFYEGQSPIEALADSAIASSFNILPNLAIGFAVPIPATLVAGPCVGAARLFNASADTVLAVGRAGYTVTDYGTALLFLGSFGVGTYSEVDQFIQDIDAASKLQTQLDDAQTAGDQVDSIGIQNQIQALQADAATQLGSILANIATIGVVVAVNRTSAPTPPPASTPTSP